MPDQKPPETSDRRPCERCGRTLELVTNLPRGLGHPAYRILECVSCGSLKWIAEHTGAS